MGKVRGNLVCHFLQWKLGMDVPQFTLIKTCSVFLQKIELCYG